MSYTILDKDYMEMDLGMAYRFLDATTILTDIHDHNYYEYFIIISGSILHDVNGKQQELKTGDMVFIRPRDKHRYQISENQNLKLINVSFRTLHFDRVAQYFGDNEVLKKMLEAPDPPTVSLPATQITALKKKHYLLNVSPNRTALLIQLKTLLTDVFSHFIIEYEHQSQDFSSKWLQTVLSQMNTPENIEEGLPALLRYSGFSHGHLCRIMKSKLGITPTKYITNLRLQYAANLLVTTDYDILSISLRLGFSSLSHFITIFKAKYELSPSKYRAAHSHIGTWK